jgi:hypothetical protein
MLRFLSGVFKIVLVSLVTGAVLSAFDLSAADILIELGLTPERVVALMQQGATWALPNIILGSMVILPIWLVVFILRPPRS